MSISRWVISLSALRGRSAEERVHLRRRHDVVVAVAEVGHVQAERAVFLQVEQLLDDHVAIDRLAVRRQAHQLVLAAVDLEAREVGHRRVQETEGVREAQLLHHLETIAPAHGDRAGGPLADAVQGEDGRLLEGRREERAGPVRLVVGHEDVLALVRAREPLVELARHEELLLEPEGQAHQEQLEARRRVRDVGLEDAVELEERLVVEGDEVEVRSLDAGLLEAVVDRVLGERVVVLLARETLFLRGRDDPAVLHQAGRAVVVERRDAQDVHSLVPCSHPRNRLQMPASCASATKAGSIAGWARPRAKSRLR